MICVYIEPFEIKKGFKEFYNKKKDWNIKQIA